MMPYGHIEITLADGSTRTVMPWSVGLTLFVVLVFVIGIAMGVGKAAVYKHIPEYFPHDVGAVGGLVGMLGGLGGFFLPPVFAYLQSVTGQPQSTFGVLFVITGVSAIWMHLTVYRMLHQHAPHLSDTFEHPVDGVRA
jgi:NNP family nitrate/nitrite transporter-like MFS transporter